MELLRPSRETNKQKKKSGASKRSIEVSAPYAWSSFTAFCDRLFFFVFDLWRKVDFPKSCERYSPSATMSDGYRFFDKWSNFIWKILRSGIFVSSEFYRGRSHRAPCDSSRKSGVFRALKKCCCWSQAFVHCFTLLLSWRQLSSWIPPTNASTSSPHFWCRIICVGALRDHPSTWRTYRRWHGKLEVTLSFFFFRTATFLYEDSGKFLIGRARFMSIPSIVELRNVFFGGTKAASERSQAVHDRTLKRGEFFYCSFCWKMFDVKTIFFFCVVLLPPVRWTGEYSNLRPLPPSVQFLVEC